MNRRSGFYDNSRDGELARTLMPLDTGRGSYWSGDKVLYTDVINRSCAIAHLALINPIYLYLPIPPKGRCGDN